MSQTEHVDTFRLLCVWLFFAMVNGVLGLLWLVAAGYRDAYSNAVVVTTGVQFVALLVGAGQAGVTGVALALVASELLRSCVLLTQISARFTEPGGRPSCIS